MDEHYNIAGIHIKLTGDALPLREALEVFKCEPVEKPDTAIRVFSKPLNIEPVYNYTEGRKRWGKLNDGRKVLSFSGMDAAISPDWSEIEAYVHPALFTKMRFMNPFMELLFYNTCLLHKSIVLHAAAIEYNGGGIVVSAPAGTGKSTHCDLWTENYGAEYINGDRPLLRIVGDEPVVCGTAWSGTASIYKNVRVPLTAIIFIEQHPENIIEKLDIVPALQKMIPRCFLPYHDRDFMALAMDNVEAVITRADCYLLKCTPDLEAAELVKKCITANKK